MTRQVVLDTETTGISPKQGHRIIEVGCVELVERKLTRNTLHVYINPEREVDAGAVKVHGLTSAFLADKPRFVDVVEEIIDFIQGAELIIHNAAFDVGFLNHEFRLAGRQFKQVHDHSTVLDTLALAREKHPGQRNSLDALCQRYCVDNSSRDLHGALLDSELLAQVYLRMTGGQSQLFGGGEETASQTGSAPAIKRVSQERGKLVVIAPTPEEQALHDRYFVDEVDG